MRPCSGRCRTCRASDLRRRQVERAKPVPESLAQRNRLRASAQFLNRSVSEFAAAHFLGFARLESGLRDPCGFDARHGVQTAPPTPATVGEAAIGTEIAGRVLSAKVAEPRAWREGEWPPSSLPGHSHRRFLRVGDRFSDGAAQMSSRGGTSLRQWLLICRRPVACWTNGRRQLRPGPRGTPTFPCGSNELCRCGHGTLSFEYHHWREHNVEHSSQETKRASLNRPTQKKLSTDIKTDKFMY